MPTTGSDKKPTLLSEEITRILENNETNKKRACCNGVVSSNLKDKKEKGRKIRIYFPKLKDGCEVEWDATNKDLVEGLNIDLKNQQIELNDLSIQADKYDLQTQPAKDLIKEVKYTHFKKYF